MAVPSRAYVGVVTFGILVVLPIMAYTILLLAGYTPPPSAPHEVLFPAEPVRDWAQITFLSIALVFSAAFTFFAARALLQAARRDERKRAAIREMKAELKRYKRQRHDRLRPPN